MSDFISLLFIYLCSFLMLICADLFPHQQATVFPDRHKMEQFGTQDVTICHHMRARNVLSLR